MTMTFLDIINTMTPEQKHVLCSRYLSGRNTYGQLTDIDGSWRLEHGVVVINETRSVQGINACWKITHRILPNGRVLIEDEKC